MNYASRGQRLFGQIVDAFIGAAPFLLVGWLNGPFISGAIFWFAIGWSIFNYFFADGMVGGQSFAKRWLGMHVISEATGLPCTYWQSFLRNVLLWILGPIDWIFIFGDKHQRLGDKLAGTIVILD